MGLKLQPSVNLLNTLLKNNLDVGALIFTSQDTPIDLNNRLRKLISSTGFDQVQGSMDRLLEQNNRECVRNTMMRQEEIFKQQLHELHRLHRVQKMLMAELRSKEAQLPSHATATTLRAVMDTKSKYLSSTTTSEISQSSIRHKESWADEECDVDLTLSIGCSSSKKKTKNWIHPEPTTSETRHLLLSNTGARPERGEECSERESLQRPPWLFPAMSLNRT